MTSHYNKNLKDHSRDLRVHSTPGEIILWNKVLKNKQQLGFQFLRQFAIDNYIVDFICRKAKLIIEIDGYSHNFKYEKDQIRDENLGNLGFKVLRFQEKEIHQNLEKYNSDNSAIFEKFGGLNVNPPAPFAKGEKVLKSWIEI